jgi:nucleoid DNA-binding protein
MKKAELVKHIATMAGISNKQADTALNATLDAIKQTVFSGQKVWLSGFGTFSLHHRAAHKGRNPQTGEIIDIATKTFIGFKASK